MWGTVGLMMCNIRDASTHRITNNKGEIEFSVNLIEICAMKNGQTCFRML